VVHEDEQHHGGTYLPKSNIIQIVSSPSYQQLQTNNHQSKMMSRERNGKIILNNQGGSRNYGVGSQHNMGKQDALKLVNVYSNV